MVKTSLKIKLKFPWDQPLIGMQEHCKRVVSCFVGLEQGEAFLICLAIEYDCFELLRWQVDWTCKSQLLDSIRSAYHHIYDWALGLGCQGVLVFFEGHMSGKQLPDMHIDLRIFLVLLRHLDRELELVAKGLVQERDNKGVLGHH